MQVINLYPILLSYEALGTGEWFFSGCTIRLETNFASLFLNLCHHNLLAHVEEVTVRLETRLAGSVRF